MAEWMSLPDGVTKNILSGGKGDLPEFPDGSKVQFHYRTLYVNEDGERHLLDDSKKEHKPFELLIGKKFKLDIWEVLIKTMRIDEVGEFLCEPHHVGSYPAVSKSLRDMYKKEKHKGHSHGADDDHHTHTCGFAAMSQGLGYEDLDEYVKNPKPLLFQMELLKVELPGSYERDVWSLSLDEKLKFLPQWKEEGNALYKQEAFEQACDKYAKALGSLEQLTTREKPETPEWLELEKMKIPFLLNFAQCKISMKEYYQAIEHLTSVIEKDKENVKAFYRRAKAYHCVFSLKEARADYQTASNLDKSLVNIIEQELKKIQVDERKKDQEDRQKFKNAFA